MLKKVIAFLICIVTISCGDINREERKIEIAKGKKIETNFIGNSLLFVEDSLFLFYNSKDGEYPIVKTYFLSNNKLKEKNALLLRGEGEYELKAPFFVSNVTDTLYIFDFVKNKGFKINKKENVLDEKQKWEKIILNSDNNIIKPSLYTNSCILLNPNEILLFGDKLESKNILSLYDVKNQKYTPLDFWIEDDISVPNITKQLVYLTNSKIYKHPLKNIFVYACGSGEYVEFFFIDNKQISHRKIVLNRKPLYYPVELNFKIAKTEIDKPHGIKFIVPTEKYVYIMSNSIMYNKDWEIMNYKGYSSQHNDTFEVFDWEGNHIKTIELELPCYDLGWDSKNNTLYTLTEAEDSDIMMKYNLE